MPPESGLVLDHARSPGGAKGVTSVRVDASSNVDAFAKLSDKTEQVAAEVQVAVVKQTLETAEQSMLQLLNSMQPHLGQNVDARA